MNSLDRIHQLPDFTVDVEPEEPKPIPPTVTPPAECPKCGGHNHLVNAQSGSQTFCPDCGLTTTGCVVWVGSHAGQPVEKSVYAGDLPAPLVRNLEERERQRLAQD